MGGLTAVVVASCPAAFRSALGIAADSVGSALDAGSTVATRGFWRAVKKKKIRNGVQRDRSRAPRTVRTSTTTAMNTPGGEKYVQIVEPTRSGLDKIYDENRTATNVPGKPGRIAADARPLGRL